MRLRQPIFDDEDEDTMFVDVAASEGPNDGLPQLPQDAEDVIMTDVQLQHVHQHAFHAEPEIAPAHPRQQNIWVWEPEEEPPPDTSSQ